MEDFSTIYVDLDSLFDTRLSTLYKLDSQRVAGLLKNGYFSRDYDEFDGYDVETYHKAYQQRDASTIHHSSVTDVPRIILYFAEQTLKARASTPFVKQPRLHLNIYPYVLPEEAIVAIVEGVKLVTKGLIDIEIIDTPLEQITPSYVKKTYAMLVMYEYWNWLEIHAANRNFESTFCPEITLIGPAIVRSKTAWEQVKTVDIYPIIEQYSSMFIKLTLYPVTTFCVNIERMVKAKQEVNVDA